MNLSKFALVFAAGLAIGAYQPEVQQPTRPKMEMEVESRLSFDETVEAVKAAAVAQKYTVLAVHEMSKTLESKGFPREALTVVEVCNAKQASTALQNDIRAGLMMPCPVMVYSKGGKVMVQTFDTRVISQFYEGGDAMKGVGDSVFVSLWAMLKSVKK